MAATLRWGRMTTALRMRGTRGARHMRRSSSSRSASKRRGRRRRGRGRERVMMGRTRRALYSRSRLRRVVSGRG